MPKHNPYGSYPKFPMDEKPSRSKTYQDNPDYIDEDLVEIERRSSGGLDDSSPENPPIAVPGKPFRFR
jgi:hypothetical protein